MLWVLGAVVLVVFVSRVVRSRREIVAVFPGQPVSTLHSAWSKRTRKETKAALSAATSLLR
jgi:hypothetical protein